MRHPDGPTTRFSIAIAIAMISDRHLLVVLRSERRVALLGDLIRAAVAGAVLLVIALWLLYYATVVRLMFTELHMNDFGKFYYSARLFLDGQDMYGPSPATEVPVGEHETRQFWNMNPPHFHLLMLPLARLEPLAALLVWTLLNGAALVWSLRLIAGELELRWTPAGVLWTTLAVASCSATGMILVTGQLTFLLLPPVTLSWVAARRGDLVRAGVYLGLVASVKPFMGIFLIYWVVRRHWRAAAAMTVAGMALGVIGLAIFGVGTYETWIRALRQVEWPWAPMNASITGIVARVLGPSPFFEPLQMAPAAIPVVSGILSAFAGILTFGLLAADRTSAAADRAYAGLMAAALLISPLGWAYYIPLLAGPSVALAVGARGRPSMIRRVFMFGAIPGLLLPSLLTLAWAGTPLAGVTLGSVYGWTLLFIWGGVLTDAAAALRRARGSPAGSPR